MPERHDKTASLGKLAEQNSEIRQKQAETGNYPNIVIFRKIGKITLMQAIHALKN